MPWVESASPSFRARHESADAADAVGVLHSLERTRERLLDLFPRGVDGFTVIVHRSAEGAWRSHLARIASVAS